MSPRPAVLVTNAAHGSALAVIRSLGRSGWRVIPADSDPRSAGFRSCYAEPGVVHPRPEVAPEACVETLLAASRERSVGLIVPVSEPLAILLSRHRDRFAGTCRIALPDPSALEVALDKERTLALAARLGIPAPATRLVHSCAEASACAADLGWPVVLKPQSSVLMGSGAGVAKFTVSYAATPTELADRMRVYEGQCGVLLQEYYAGTGVGVELLLHEGRPLAAFQHRRLREFPIYGGASSFRESVPLDPALYEQAVRLLAELRWTGLAMVEFKVGRDGPRLMEINGRIWGSLPLAVMSGVDFPARLANLFLDGPPAAEAPVANTYVTGVRARNLELDLLWIASVLAGGRPHPYLPAPKRTEGLLALLGLLNPTVRCDAFALDDPAPAVADVAKILAKALRARMSSPVPEVEGRTRDSGLRASSPGH